MLSRILLVLFSLAVAVPTPSDWKELVCRDGFRIEREFVFLPEENFTRDRLYHYLERHADSDKGELYLTVSSDSEFLETLRNLPPRLHHADYPYKLPVKTSKPLAYFFRIGQNAFFQYRDSNGKVEWVVLKGRNVFNYAIKGNPVLYAGQDFGVVGPNFPCLTARRSLTFVVENLEKIELGDIKQILRFYDSVFPYPEDLSIHLDTTFAEAGIFGFPLPSLNGDLAQMERVKLRKSVSFFRPHSSSREMMIYDEKGKLAFSQKLTASFSETK